jgi:hypothetical protein
LTGADFSAPEGLLTSARALALAYNNCRSAADLSEKKKPAGQEAKE